MGPQTPAPPARTVEDLLARCRDLSESLADLDRAEAGRLEDRLERHLGATQQLCAEIGALVHALAGRTAEPGALAEPDAHLCRALVEQAGGDYACLAAALRELRDGVAGQLASIEQGARVLRGYRRGSRMGC